MNIDLVVRLLESIVAHELYVKVEGSVPVVRKDS